MRTPRKIKMQQGGFTLLELLISIGVITVLSFVVILFFTNMLRETASIGARADLLHEAQLTLDKIGNDIRLSANADQNNRWPDGNAPGGNQYGWASNSSTLILATAVQNSDGDILFEDPAQYITYKNNNIYFLQNGTLYRRTLAADVTGNTAKTTCPAASASANCPRDGELLHNVDGFSIRYINGEGNDVTPTDARSIELTISLSKNALQQRISVSYTTRMVFRND